MTVLARRKREVDDCEVNEIRARVFAAGGEESFCKLLAEVESVARDPEERLRLLSERVLMDLFRRNPKAKAHRQKRLGVIVSFGQIPKKKRSNLRRFRARKTLESKSNPHSGPTIDEAVAESILTAMAAEKKRPAVELAPPPRKVHLTVKFRNVMIARIDSLVSVS